MPTCTRRRSAASAIATLVSGAPVASMTMSWGTCASQSASATSATRPPAARTSASLAQTRNASGAKPICSSVARSPSTSRSQSTAELDVRRDPALREEGPAEAAVGAGQRDANPAVAQFVEEEFVVHGCGVASRRGLQRAGFITARVVRCT